MSGHLTANVAPYSAVDQGSAIALVHEWLGKTGGSEQVFMSMASALPEAETFALWRDANCEMVLPGLKESWLAKTPLRHSKAVALPFMPIAWRTLSRQNYRLVISSSHAFAHTVKMGDSEETRYLSYIHSPARYIWSTDLDARGSTGALGLARSLLKRADVRLSSHVHSYAANSVEVQSRIKRYWGRDARVINPPVDVKFFMEPPASARQQNCDYLLGVGRWISYKRFDLMIDIAYATRLPLTLAGGGPDEASLRRRASSLGVDVTFERYPSKNRLRELYWGAKCLLFPGHEDFGIIPVEAQACGTPVVGLARGGLLETVSDGLTGILVRNQSIGAYVGAIKRVSEVGRDAARAQSLKFSQETFKQSMISWVQEEG